MRSALLVLAFAFVAVPARAQSDDAQWSPWLGCWTLATENLRAGGSQDNLTPAARPSTPATGSPRVCVTRVAGGARFETSVGSQTAVDQTIVADGTNRPVTDADCTGTQRAEWSKSGLRLFSSAEVRCQGDPGIRRVSGFSLIAPNGDWLDIQTVAIDSRETISIKRYFRDATSSRRLDVGSSRLTLDEVADAIGKVSPAALEAALVETGAGFNLTSKSVKTLHSAGVPEGVIDLIVALSYPDKFLVERGVPQGAPRSAYRDPYFSGFGYPYYYDGFYGSPYFYEPFGWRAYSGFEPSIIVVSPGGGGAGGNIPNGPGRAVNGLGYTRVVPRGPAPDSGSVSANPSGTSARTARSSSGSEPSSSSSSGSSSSGSSGGSASPSGGYSSGSSGGSSDTGRTAVPR